MSRGSLLEPITKRASRERGALFLYQGGIFWTPSLFRTRHQDSLEWSGIGAILARYESGLER